MQMNVVFRTVRTDGKRKIENTNDGKQQVKRSHYTNWTWCHLNRLRNECVCVYVMFHKKTRPNLCMYYVLCLYFANNKWMSKRVTDTGRAWHEIVSPENSNIIYTYPYNRAVSFHRHGNCYTLNFLHPSDHRRSSYLAPCIPVENRNSIVWGGK